MKPENTSNDDFPTSSILKEVGNRNPFIVPENYFETLQARILHKVENEEKLLQTLHPFRFFSTRLLWIPAAAASLLALIYVAQPLFQGKSESDYLANYLIDNHSHFFDEHLLLEELNASNENVQNEDALEFIDYLLEQNTDINLIMEAYQ